MSSNGLNNIFSIIVNWLGNLIVPVVNVSALTVWVGIFLLGFGVWILGIVFGLVQDFVHDAQNDEKARKRDAENEQKYWRRRLENNEIEHQAYNLSKGFTNQNEWRYRWREHLLRKKLGD